MSLHRRLAPATLVFALLMVACASASSSAAALQGRWQRLDTGSQTFVGDPLSSLAQDSIEFRDPGLLVDLILDAGSGRAFTATTGGYSLVDADHIQIDGKCWQGYDSHACSQTYRFKLAGDRLTIFGDGLTIPGGPVANGQVDYQHVGPAAAALPPTIVPPMPSATP